MPLTKEANETAVRHIITAVLDREPDGPLKKCNPDIYTAYDTVPVTEFQFPTEEFTAMDTGWLLGDEDETIPPGEPNNDDAMETEDEIPIAEFIMEATLHSKHPRWKELEDPPDTPDGEISPMAICKVEPFHDEDDPGPIVYGTPVIADMLPRNPTTSPSIIHRASATLESLLGMRHDLFYPKHDYRVTAFALCALMAVMNDMERCQEIWMILKSLVKQLGYETSYYDALTAS